VARYDLDAKRLVLGEDGLAQRAATNDVGLLLAREARGARPVGTSPLRSVLAPGDAWRSTGDLFRVDEDGIHWLVGSVGSAVRTTAGRVPLTAVEDALMHCPPVDLAVAHGLPGARGRDVLAAAVTLVEGRQLEPDACSRILANRLPPGHVPTILRVVDDIETTTWFRPRRAPLRAQGAPLDRAWRWHASDRRYRPLTAEDVERLLV
jgi:putative long chain acyl-CoA synthase